MNRGRPRAEMLEELEALASRLDQRFNKVLHEEMGHLVKELGSANRDRRSYDCLERAASMRHEYDRWADKHQDIAEKEASVSKAWQATPRETPVNFTGENAQAFWAHLAASVMSNKALDSRQKMAHFLSRVKDHRDAAALVAGFSTDGSDLSACLEAFKTNYLDEKKLEMQALKRAESVRSLGSTDDQQAITAFISEIRVLQTLLKGESANDNKQYSDVWRILMSKMPATLQKEAYLHLADHNLKDAQGFSETDSIPSKSSQWRKDAPLLELLLRFLERHRVAAGWQIFHLGPSTEPKSLLGSKTIDKRPYPQHDRYPHKRPVAPRIYATTKEGCAACDSRQHSSSDCNVGSARERYNRIRRAGLCLKCLQHQYDKLNPCTQGKPCKHCGKSHHHVICSKPKQTRVHLAETDATKEAEVMTATPTFQQNRVYLSVLPALILTPTGATSIGVLLDSGAETSLITTEAVTQAGIKSVTVEPITLHGVTDGTRRTDTMAALTLASTDYSFQIDVSAYITPRITSNFISTPTEELQKQAQEKGVVLDMSSLKGKKVNLLLGQDWLFAFLVRSVVPLGPFIGALKSPLGWYIAGREGGPTVQGSVVQLSCQQLCQDLARIYEYVEPEEMKLMEDSAPQTMISYDQASSTYAVSLPKRSLERLANNERNAWSRVMALRRKLIANGQYEEYDQAIKEYLKKGYAEIAPKLGAHEKSYMIPHHAVWKKDATKTKCRIVFDASAAVPGHHSLNQCMSKGESINADIWSVTLRFRLAPIILVTDLVKAFSQIQIISEDRNFLRYLWFENPEDTSPTVYRMTSVIFGATSSPYLLGAVLQEHTRRFGAEFPEVAKQMDAAMYMDDGFFSADSTEQAQVIMAQAQAFFAKASFGLHPWLSNVPSVQIGDQPMGDPDVLHSTLGVRWLPRTDTMQVKCVEADRENRPVKRRQALSLLAQFYDPLSLFAPLKTRIRLFIRDLAMIKESWDTELTSEEKKRLKRITDEMKMAAEKTVPRSLETGGLRELHVFGDASPQAFGAVAYLVNPSTGKRLLLCAKHKLAPKKFRALAEAELLRELPKVTIPRLELMAAVMTAQLATSVLKKLPESTPVAFYSDSDITVKRIQSDCNRQEPFEMRRLQVILELTDASQWFHVESAQNPADLLTRDCSAKVWLRNPLWWSGPDSAVSPLRTARSRVVRECLTVQADPLTAEEMDLCKEDYDTALRRMKELIDGERKAGVSLESLNEGKARALDEASYAVMRVWSLVQKQLFAPEIELLKAGRFLPTRSRIRPLSPFLDEWGVLRSKRLAQPQSVEWECRHPLILAQHALVRQLVRREHERLGHAGEAATRSHISQHYHLVRGRRLIRGVVRPCHQCNIQRGRPFCPPEPSLPPFRTDFRARPFSYVGLDHFGPLKIKGSSKVYGLMMTCAVTRAVHMEVVTSLNSRHCLNALERFFARRGVPKQIHSDNAKTFVASNRALTRLAELVEGAQAHKDLEKYQIQWFFQTPRAPWFGAFFERMIGVSKRVIEQTNLSKVSNLDDVRTIVAQVEAIVNSRPLIEVDKEGIVALTPAHFLIGTSLLALPPFPSADGPPEQNHLLTHYRDLCESRTLLQTRLQKEYLVALRKHHRINNPTRGPVLGEWVLVTGEDYLGKDRFGWPVEQIQELIPDADGHVRRAKISWRGGTLERPVRSLIPLEGVHEPPQDPRVSKQPETTLPTMPEARECGKLPVVRSERLLRRSRRLAERE